MSVMSTFGAVGRDDPVNMASGAEDTGSGGDLPARWWLGIILALIALRVLYEMSE